MRWKEGHVMDERLRCVARLLEGEKMAPLCAEFGISRKTGYKIGDRYKDCEVQALTTGAIARIGSRIGLPAPSEAAIVRLKRKYPGWERRRAARNVGSSSLARTCQPSARCTPCWI